jgi:pimeloyl-ACP methyl ester carboxylesterase
MPYIKVNGITLHYIDKGKGKILLFLHSWMSNSEIYENQINELSKKYRVISVDLRGHGKSTKVKAYNADVFSKDLHIFIKKLGLKNITLIGSSLGGNIAAHYAINYRDGIDSLILVNASAKYISDRGYDTGHSSKLVRTMFLHLLIYGYKKLIRRSINNLFAENTSHKERNRVFQIASAIPFTLALRIGVGMIFFDIREDLKKIKVPTLVLYGIEDKLCNFYSAKFFTDNIPNSKLVVFEKSGHFPFIEEKEKFNSEIRKFVG